VAGLAGVGPRRAHLAAVEVVARACVKVVSCARCARCTGLLQGGRRAAPDALDARACLKVVAELRQMRELREMRYTGCGGRRREVEAVVVRRRPAEGGEIR
jgi:hypothetical protein